MRLFVFLLFLVVLVSGCLEDDGPGVKCGDGVCDRFERENPGVCPGDCVQAEGGGKMGFIGCSITHNAIDGYEMVGGRNFWSSSDVAGGFGGGCLSMWHSQLGGTSEKKDYWRIFRDVVEKNPDAEIIWWELCSCHAVSKLSYDDIVEVLDEIERIAPGVEIYASPMPVFSGTTEGMCVGAGSPQVTKDAVERMVREGKVRQGPILTHLKIEQTTGDGCHATGEGKEIWGKDLVGFFDKNLVQ